MNIPVSCSEFQIIDVATQPSRRGTVTPGSFKCGLHAVISSKEEVWKQQDRVTQQRRNLTKPSFARRSRSTTQERSHVDGMFPWHDVMCVALDLLWSSSQNRPPHFTHEKNNRQIQCGDILQNPWPILLKLPGHRKPDGKGKSENLPQPREA